jgi:chemotaxis protein MotB
MLFRSILVLTSLAALPFLGSCTARYQDLLRDRDSTIRELNGRIARLQAQNDDLQKQSELAAADTSHKNAAPAVTAPENSSTASKVQNEIGDEGTVGYRRGRLSISIQDTVTFDSGSTALKDTAHRVLQKVANVLKRDYPDHRIYIEGHTDSDPIEKTKDKYRNNRHLSVERADSVARYLVEKCSVPERRIVVVGYGQYDPKDPNKKSLNRRVEIVVGESM